MTKLQAKVVSLTTSKKFKVNFCLPVFSLTKIIMWLCHVEDSSEIRYDIILVRYLITTLEINLRVSENFIEGGWKSVWKVYIIYSLHGYVLVWTYKYKLYSTKIVFHWRLNRRSILIITHLQLYQIIVYNIICKIKVGRPKNNAKLQRNINGISTGRFSSITTQIWRIFWWNTRYMKNRSSRILIERKCQTDKLKTISSTKGTKINVQ